MSTCSIPSPLLGNLDNLTCPVESTLDTTLSFSTSFLRYTNMVLTLVWYFLNPVGAVMRLSFNILGLIITPLVWIIRPVYSLVSTTLSWIIAPFFIPWRITVWFWYFLIDLYYELEPIMIYLSFAILLGLTAGFSVGLLTLLILRLLRAIFPFLRPQEGQQQRQRQRFTIGRQKANHRHIPSLSFTTTPRTPPELLAIMQEDFPVPYDSTSSSPSTPSEHDYDADAGTATTTTTTTAVTTTRTTKRLRSSPRSSPSPSTASSQPSHPRHHHNQKKQQQRPSLSSRTRRLTTGGGVAARAGRLVEDTIHEESSDY